MCLDKIRFMKKIKLSLVILLVVVSCLFLIVPSSSALYPPPEHPTNFPDWVRFLSPASLLAYLSIGLYQSPLIILTLLSFTLPFSPILALIFAIKEKKVCCLIFSILTAFFGIMCIFLAGPLFFIHILVSQSILALSIIFYKMLNLKEKGLIED